MLAFLGKGQVYGNSNTTRVLIRTLDWTGVDNRVIWHSGRYIHKSRVPIKLLLMGTVENWYYSPLYNPRHLPMIVS